MYLISCFFLPHVFVCRGDVGEFPVKLIPTLEPTMKTSQARYLPGPRCSAAKIQDRAQLHLPHYQIESVSICQKPLNLLLRVQVVKYNSLG